MALSEFKIHKAKTKDKPYKLFYTLGLFLLVNPSGSKLWRHKYKYMGKERLTRCLVPSCDGLGLQ
ncbi:Arm DNA-binding domain-containing protein [Profundibacter sp.]